MAKASPGVEDGPDTKKAKLDPSETTMVKKVSEPGCVLRGKQPSLGLPTPKGGFRVGFSPQSCPKLGFLGR